MTRSSSSLAHFKVLVAKDAVVKQFGNAIANWPDNNFWTMVSSYKSNITDEQLPALMKKYKLTSLSDYPPSEVTEV